VKGLVLLSKPGCHLCDEMKATIAPVLSELGLTLTELDVRDDPDNRARWASERLSRELSESCAPPATLTAEATAWANPALWAISSSVTRAA